MVVGIQALNAIAQRARICLKYIKEQANVVFKAPKKLKEIPIAFNNIQLMETSKDERKLTCAATAQAGSRTLDLQYYLELIKNADGTEMIALRRV